MSRSGIDGQQLGERTVDLNLEVTVRSTFEVKRIDSDVFLDEYVELCSAV